MILENPFKIYIKLTEKCNLNCTYCIQHNYSNIDNNFYKTFNYDIIDFLNNNVKRTDNKKTKLIFFGGEPLLKFKLIKEISEKINNPVLHKIILTNGVLLSKDIINYCNDNNISIVVSWDGTISEKTRGYDIIKKQYSNLFLINNFEISSLTSNDSIIYDKLNYLRNFNKKYTMLHNYPVHINIKNIRKYPYNNNFYNTLDTEINDICNNFYKFTKNDLEYTWISPWFNYKKKMPRNEYDLTKYYKYISIRSDGSILYSSSIDKKISDIYQDSMPEKIYFNERYKECTNCEVNNICYFYLNNPEMIDYSNKNYFCKAVKLLYSPILKLKDSSNK